MRYEVSGFCDNPLPTAPVQKFTNEAGYPKFELGITDASCFTFEAKYRTIGVFESNSDGTTEVREQISLLDIGRLANQFSPAVYVGIK